MKPISNNKGVIEGINLHLFVFSIHVPKFFFIVTKIYFLSIKYYWIFLFVMMADLKKIKNPEITKFLSNKQLF